MGVNQIHNIMNVKEFCLSFYALWKFNFATGSKPPYVAHSMKENLVSPAPSALKVRHYYA